MNGPLDFGLIAGALERKRPLAFPLVVLAWDPDCRELVVILGRRTNAVEARAWTNMASARLDAYLADASTVSGVCPFPGGG